MGERLAGDEAEQRPSPATILRVLGAGLLLASVWIMLDHGTDEWRQPYEQGQLLGSAAGFVALSIVGATLGHYAYLRRRGDEASWSRVTPEALAIGGLLAFYLALFVGPPTTEQQDMLIAAEECSASQPNPTEALPTGDVRELTDSEVALTPGVGVAQDQFPGVMRFFESGRDAGQALIITWAVGEEDDVHGEIDVEAERVLRAEGFLSSPLDLGVEEVRSFTMPGTPQSVYLAHQGCYAFAVFAIDPASGMARTQAILGAGPPGSAPLT